MAISKTMQAVRRVQAGETVREAARALDISESAIYAQIKREKDRPRCPCCGQVVKEGFKIDRTMVKSQAPKKR